MGRFSDLLKGPAPAAPAPAPVKAAAPAKKPEVKKVEAAPAKVEETSEGGSEEE